jgi:hypothetical protein
MHVTYGFHDVLSWGADFQGMMSELSRICRVCADLALFGGKTRLSVMVRRPELELTVGTLRIANSVTLSEKCLDILTLDSFKVKANHLVVQVKNATSVRYTKSNGGYKPNH